MAACPCYAPKTLPANDQTLRGRPVQDARMFLNNTGLKNLNSDTKEAYKRRKQPAEPVFGIIKEQMGVPRFLLRG